MTVYPAPRKRHTAWDDQRMRRFLAVAVLVSAVVVLRPEPAGACSCDSFDTAEALAETEGAFVGRLVVRRQNTAGASGDDTSDGEYPDFLYRFRVDDAVKGSFPSEVVIHSGEGGGDCGIQVGIGEPIGLLLYRWHGQLRSDLCSQIEPDTLRRAVEPVPRPDGQPPIRLLVGTSYGPGRVLSLDRRGRVVAFGGGQGLTTVIAVCPGGQRMVEVSRPAQPTSPVVPVLTVRRVFGLAIEAEIPLPGFGPEGGVYREVEALSCRDSAGHDVVMFVREESPDYHSRIVRLRDTERLTMWEGTATHGAFHAEGRLAFVAGGRRGTDLMAVDLTAEPPVPRPVTTLPPDSGPLVVNAGGELAMLCGGPGAPGLSPLLVVSVDPSTAQMRTVEIPGESVNGEVVWTGDRRLVFVPDWAADAVRVYDHTLRQETSWTGWASSRAVVVGQTLVGLDHGLIRTSPVEGGEVVRFADLGDGLPGAITPVPVEGDGSLQSTDVAAPPRFGLPEERHERGAGSTILALVAVLVAGTATAVYSFSRRRSGTSVG
jgi:hypothetical protein